MILFNQIDNNFFHCPDLETKKDEVALLLKLKHAASELVSFGPQFDNQFVKFSFSGIYILSVEKIPTNVIIAFFPLEDALIMLLVLFRLSF